MDNLTPDRTDQIDNEVEYNIWKMGLIIDTSIMAGETVYPGTRITVKQIGQLVECGCPIDEIMNDYGLSRMDVIFAARYLCEDE